MIFNFFLKSSECDELGLEELKYWYRVMEWKFGTVGVVATAFML